MREFPQFFDYIYRRYRRDLLAADSVDVGTWHSQSTAGNPLLVTMEIPFTSFSIYVPTHEQPLQDDVKPNLPWAEEHFQERVSGEPVNPPPSHVNWPWAHAQHQDNVDEKFSHTYPERMWPKYANDWQLIKDEAPRPRSGIRFPWGDLQDVVTLLTEELYTRQAYLPIFFPEDTGGSARIGARIPCSLGYHFMVRKNRQDYPRMSCMYTMRSCDFVRHFRDDIYMAARLLQWVAREVSLRLDLPGDILPAQLHTHIASLHAMEGDRYKLQTEEDQDVRGSQAVEG